MKEFDSGLIACQGGKYTQDTQISGVFADVECPVWQNYDSLSKRDFIAMIWEIKGQGAVDINESLYGCLNQECAASIKTGLVSN